ncbi:enoyl-CoA hydratase/isomerase family protein [Altericroceibacterium endophyticum]|uniref:3-hydroxyisobutyryl-CoA hydrolase n=1 Tax=Altericroceibacterium endophyticum TaxID=1808508 RepID=A0A6I4T9Q4_9SPHN|nr:enoyl-CoA hydratase/isomerase family protein [Altericroceibacterium endophyticum]MXO67022.1 enoyl-CoA hydratase/isomerase family protein [Altericroceibacterium endophyticum]
MSDHVHIHRHGSIGHISLNRPKALHSLTLPMCQAMTGALLEWRADDGIDAIILDHAEGRGFCAGGDVAQVRQSVLEDGGEAGDAFFRAEYQLNHLLFTYPKPVIAFMDGVTMGGGVGLSLPAQYRIATENTLFAMPEGAIGLFPDIGAGWYLARLPGRIGPFLALTGARLDGAECLWAGLATHYLASEACAKAKSEIIARPHAIADILAELSVPAPEARLARNQEKIDLLFASDQLEEIVDALSGDGAEWAAKELKSVTAKSPLSSKVALKLIGQGLQRQDFAAEMKAEYALATHMIRQPDFAEGVRAVLVDKDNSPAWQADSAAGVSDTLVEALFTPLAPADEWSPLPGS